MANKEFQVRHGLVVNNTVLVANTITNNVGIGRANPGYALDVVGTVNASAVLVNGSPISGGGVATATLDGANAITTAAFTAANAANVVVTANVNYTNTGMQSAFLIANTALSRANAANVVVTANVNYVNTAMQSAFAIANAAFTAANSSNVVLTANVNYVNTAMQSAFGIANAAFTAANAANVVVTANVNYTNTGMQSAFLIANTALSRANAANVVVTANVNYVNTAMQSAFLVANSASANVTAAFLKANNALANTTGTFAGSLTIAGNTVISGNAVISRNPATLPAPPDTTLLHISGADNELTRFVIDAFGSNPTLTFRRAAGTGASPSATGSGQTLGAITAFGRGSTGYSSASRASIVATTSETWTDSAQGAYWTFSTTATGTVTLSERMRIDPQGNVGIGRTDPSYKLDVVGTVNASAVLVNGSPIGGGAYYQGNNGDVGSSSGLGDIFRVHTNILNANVTIYSGNNALAAGPLTVNVGRTLTIQTNARVSIV